MFLPIPDDGCNAKAASVVLIGALCANANSYVVPCCAMLSYAVLYSAMLSYAVQCEAMLCCTVLC